ncbi:MAG: SDR family NAD(P)-dependent oxidoreductase [Bacteroidia bacterium]|nr:SDR family NAD(P)-dependent oxidoreductase [Bacteroidia bacterium]MDW8014519.1 SDR family NAD(P)-dependent oxidoreductase [Bacteroidia bacterium]
MRILLTGAAGFIGSFTAQRLLQEGYEVIGIDNLNSYYHPSLKKHRLSWLISSPNFQFHALDLSDWNSMASLFEFAAPIDAVINLAAQPGVRSSLEQPYPYYQANSTGNFHLLELMRRHGIKQYVLASTSSLYAGASLPFSEDCIVDTPISPYAASKRAAEILAYTYHYQYGIDVAVLRYFTVYGPAGRPDMGIFRFIEWIYREEPLHLYGDGTQSRDFTYVEDVAEATLAALQVKGYEIFNIGGGKPPSSLLEVIHHIQKRLRKEAKIIYHPPSRADLHHTQADIRKAESLLGWRPKVEFWTGLDRTIEWHLENRELLDGLPLS